MNPEKLRFGSKIDLSGESNENFFSVKEILSPQTLILHNNLKIKLFGIKCK